MQILLICFNAYRENAKKMNIISYITITCLKLFFNCRYVNMTQDLQRLDLLELSENEKLAFFLNLHNAMVVHAMIRVRCQEGVLNRRSFSDFQYLVGGHPYSLSTIINGILRSNRRSPYSLVKPFGARDRRLEVNFVFQYGIFDNYVGSSLTIIDQIKLSVKYVLKQGKIHFWSPNFKMFYFGPHFLK